MRSRSSARSPSRPGSSPRTRRSTARDRRQAVASSSTDALPARDPASRRRPSVGRRRGAPALAASSPCRGSSSEQRSERRDRVRVTSDDRDGPRGEVQDLRRELRESSLPARSSTVELRALGERRERLLRPLELARVEMRSRGRGRGGLRSPWRAEGRPPREQGLRDPPPPTSRRGGGGSRSRQGTAALPPGRSPGWRGTGGGVARARPNGSREAPRDPSRRQVFAAACVAHFQHLLADVLGDVLDVLHRLADARGRGLVAGFGLLEVDARVVDDLHQALVVLAHRVAFLIVFGGPASSPGARRASAAVAGGPVCPQSLPRIKPPGAPERARARGRRGGCVRAPGPKPLLGNGFGR